MTSLVSLDVPTSRRSRRRRSAQLRLVALACGLAGIATACGQSPGTEADFVELLVRDGSISTEAAECIAGEVFDEYGENSDVLQKLSFVTDYTELDSGDFAVDGFTDFYDAAVATCLG